MVCIKDGGNGVILHFVSGGGGLKALVQNKRQISIRPALELLKSQASPHKSKATHKTSCNGLAHTCRGKGSVVLDT